MKSSKTNRLTSRAAVIIAAFAVISVAGCSTVKDVRSGSSGGVSTRPSLSAIQIGVTIGGIPVGGMTAERATTALKTAISDKYGSFRLRFVDVGGDDSYHYGLKDFDGYFDIPAAVKQAERCSAGSSIPLSLKVDRDLVKLHISRVAAIWRVPVQEPKVKFTADGKDVTAGHDGRTLDQQAAYDRVMASLPTLQTPKADVSMPFETLTPDVDPDKVTGLADTLVSFTTTFNPSNVTRTNNLMLSVKNINGTVVGPGEVFSYNDTVGPRTQQTGFEDAIIYVNDTMRKDVGGGICQASSTLYNCVLLANMPIVERHAHSLPVHYVPAGRDATVAWGGDDFRFRNNTAKPIIIKATATPGGTLTESLIGDRNALPHPDAKVAIDVTPQRPYEDGYAVNSFRIVKEDGVLIAKEPLGLSVYHKLVGGVPH